MGVREELFSFEMGPHIKQSNTDLALFIRHFWSL